MIIDFETDINTYEQNILKNNNPFPYVCPCCGAVHRLHRHGTYHRFIESLSDTGVPVCADILIQRVKCSSCGTTHAILPCDLIPYAIMSLSFTVHILTRILGKGDSRNRTARSLSVSNEKVRRTVLLLKRFLPLMEICLRNLHRYVSSVSLSLSEAADFLTESASLSHAFLRCHGSPLFVNRRIPVSRIGFFPSRFPHPT